MVSNTVVAIVGRVRMQPESFVGACLASCCKPNHDGAMYPKELCDKDFAELSGELSGAISLKTLVFVGSALELFRTCFGTVHAILGRWGCYLALEFHWS